MISTLYCDNTLLRHALFDDNCFLSRHQPDSNLLVSESLLQFQGVKEGPKSMIGTLNQGFESRCLCRMISASQQGQSHADSNKLDRTWQDC